MDNWVQEMSVHGTEIWEKKNAKKEADNLYKRWNS
jgi:hypothetical protein